jgi:hypothetical protein
VEHQQLVDLSKKLRSLTAAAFIVLSDPRTAGVLKPGEALVYWSCTSTAT